MYTVLIVDDEAAIREGIADVIRRHCPQFTKIFEAKDGDGALNLALECAPDLIITDIHMPGRNGLDFIEELKADQPDVATIIISGYDEFEYARQGLKLAVDDYLLKPVDTGKLTSRLQLMIEELNRKHVYRKTQEELQRIVEESLPLYRERLYRSLVEGGRDAALLTERARQLSIPLDYRFYAVALTRFHAPPSSGDELAMAAYISDIVTETVRRTAGDLTIHHFFVKDFEFVLLIGSNESTREACFAAVNRYVNQLARALQTNLHLDQVRIGLGSVVEAVRQLPRSYEQAQETMVFHLSLRDRAVLNFEELESPRIPDNSDRSLAEDIVLQVKLLNKHGVMQGIDNYLEDIIAVAGAHPHWVKLSILELAMSLLRVMKEADLNINRFLQQQEIDPYLNVQRSDSIEELKRWLTQFAGQCVNELEKSKLDIRVSHVEKVKQYVDVHFSDSTLSLRDLAAKLFLSPNYLRQLFRQEAGESFVEYLTRIRMERALEFLKDPLLRIQDVAEKVGFEEQRYFSSCFKKYYQMTPSDYREAIQEGLL